MAAAPKTDLHLEIAHVLFIDIVGYSKLLVDEQSELLEQLNDIVRETEQFRAGEAKDALIRLPTGDGMALVFLTHAEAPVRCALEMAAALKQVPELQLRMGIHSGPVNQVNDVNGRSNVAGAGINMAQRVMDCGDAGHILLSKRSADDLAHYRQWQPLLHDLGECEVKHGTVISVANLYTEELGNPKVPEKFRQAKEKTAVAARSPGRSKPLLITLAMLICLLIGVGIVAVIFAPGATKFFSQQRVAAPSPAPSASPTATAPAIPEKSIAV
ncbi:MAG: adenylate/guanylate cyclase domain-containing protein, partial [Chthoniobacterales bacterium]|nr:adenylate/guanylate cyclase domain-containing protein [Chthoniobacterales bacterium]